MKRPILVIAALISTGAMSNVALAQSSDVSPNLLIESRPSDQPDYRRMVNVKYLNGDRVAVNYSAYNRAEFKQTPNDAPSNVISQCSRGSATSLSEIQNFERDEAKRAGRGERPDVKYFCIKGVSGWEAGNRDRYLDPIFNGMPYAATLK